MWLNQWSTANLKGDLHTRGCCVGMCSAELSGLKVAVYKDLLDPNTCTGICHISEDTC